MLLSCTLLMLCLPLYFVSNMQLPKLTKAKKLVEKAKQVQARRGKCTVQTKKGKKMYKSVQNKSHRRQDKKVTDMEQVSVLLYINYLSCVCQNVIPVM